MTDISRKLAAIDVGTNSIHMIVVEATGHAYRIIDDAKEMVQLGSGSLGGRPLENDAMERAVAALTRMVSLARGRSVDSITAVATSAVREAPNRSLFLRCAAEKAGLDIEVISGEEEGDLIFRAVRAAVDFHGTALSVDIGGGSVELVLGTESEVFFTSSVPLGALRLTQAFFKNDPPSKKELNALERHVRKAMKRTLLRIRDLGFDFCIGTSGTILALGEIGGKRESGESGAATLRWIDRHQLEDVVSRLKTMTVEERSAVFGMERRRAETILAGGIVLLQTMSYLRLERLRTCQAALREGIIERELEREGAGDVRPSSVRSASVLELAQRSHYGRAHAEQVARLAGRIFDQTAELHKLGSEERELLEYAAILHEIGLHVSFQRHHKHSYYLIRHAGLKGFTDEQVAVIANVARYFRKAVPDESHANFAELDETQRIVVEKLSAILRIAEGLDRGHRQSVRDVAVRRRGRNLRFEITAASRPEVEMESASRRASYFSGIFSVRAEFAESPRQPDGGQKRAS